MAKILFDGDSITDCYRTHNLLSNEFYSGEGNIGLGFPCLLKSMLKVLTNADNTYLNNAIDGSTTETLLKRIDKSIDFKANYLLLLIGINDCFFEMKSTNTVDKVRFEKNYREILTKMTKDNSSLKIIIQTISYNQGDNSDQNIVKEVNLMNDIIKKIADEFNCMVVDTNALLAKKVNETKLLDWFCPDGIHLTHNAYMYIADKLLPYLI